EAASRADRNYLPADARIFSRATPPFEAYFPKVMPITAAALVASLLIAAVVTLLAELFSGRAMRPAQRAVFVPVEEVAMPVVERAEEPEVDAPLQDPAEAAPDASPAREELSIPAAADRLVSGG